MADQVARLPKPKLRGHLEGAIKKNLITAGVLCFVAVLSFKHFVGDARKKRHLEFYRNYDPEKDFERMAKLGYFQSVE